MHISLGEGDPDLSTATDSTVGAPLPAATQAADCAQVGWLYDPATSSCIPGGTQQDPATSCPAAGYVLVGGTCVKSSPAQPFGGSSSNAGYIALAIAAALALFLGMRQ